MFDVVSWQDAMEEFLLTKQAEGRAPRTLADYRKHLSRFFDECPDAWPSFTELKKDEFDRFVVLKSITYFDVKSYT